MKKNLLEFEAVTDKRSKAKIGDKVFIDTEGFDKKGKSIETTTMKNYPIILGSNVLVPGFEEKIEWAKLEDELDLDITFPKDYHNKDFASKEVKFKVKVNSIEKAIKPEFTPEFIKQLRGKDLDLDGFKKLIKEELTETKEMNQRLEDENKLIDELLKVTKLEIWESLLKNQIEKVYAEIKENITQSWAKVNDYIASLGMNEEDYKEKNVKPIALKRLQAELILHKLQEIEKFEVEEKEISKEIEKTISKFESPDVLKRLKELYVPGTKYYEELKGRIAYRKLIDSFFETK